MEDKTSTRTVVLSVYWMKCIELIPYSKWLKKVYFSFSFFYFQGRWETERTVLCGGGSP